MNILVVAECNQDGLRSGSLHALQCAKELASASGGSVSWLIIGADIGQLAAEAAEYAPVLVADAAALKMPIAAPWAKVIASCVSGGDFDAVVAASSSIAKDVIPRATALLGGSMASDIVKADIQDGRLEVDCPRYAGAVTTTVRLLRDPQVITVRPSAFAAADKCTEALSIQPVENLASDVDERVKIESSEHHVSSRPDVTEASIVVSGGRAIENSEDFERLVGGLADTLGGATGSSRALVDAGITPNDLQVGQTGKIVAPEWYIALGISGAIQHLAGMKNSRRIVAINSDPDAPIFEMADYALIGDIYQLVPELIEKLACHATTAAS